MLAIHSLVGVIADSGFAPRNKITTIHPMDDPAKALEEACKAGFDLDLLDASLALSVEERWTRHDAALKLALELQAEGLIDEIEGMRIDQVYAIAAKRRKGGV